MQELFKSRIAVHRFNQFAQKLLDPAMPLFLDRHRTIEQDNRIAEAMLSRTTEQDKKLRVCYLRCWINLSLLIGVNFVKGIGNRLTRRRRRRCFKFEAAGVFLAY